MVDYYQAAAAAGADENVGKQKVVALVLLQAAEMTVFFSLLLQFASCSTHDKNTS
jgi:hypothetical protein